jgi:hypothetical protein
MQEKVILVVGYDGAELLDIACVTSSLDIANRIGANPPYRTVLATPGDHSITRLGAAAARPASPGAIQRPA